MHYLFFGTSEPFGGQVSMTIYMSLDKYFNTLAISTPLDCTYVQSDQHFVVDILHKQGFS